MNHTHPTEDKQLAHDAIEDAMQELRGSKPDPRATRRLLADIFAEPDREVPEPFCEMTGGW